MNSINAGIVDQRILGIIDNFSDILPRANDVDRKKSAAFVLLCMSTALDVPLNEALELLTEGGNDVGIDGVHIGEVDDGEFTISLFQGKYKVKDLSGEANFPENDIRKIISTISVLFDPGKSVSMNSLIAPKVEEIRSLVRDGYVPNVRVVLCNNGARWTLQAQEWIDQSGISEDQIQWLHWNHDSIVSVLQKRKAVEETLHLNGKATIEEFNFRRVLIGKMRVSEVAELFNRHGDLLLERNIRRYLGLHSNRVNLGIHNTLVDERNRNNFYFLNNGITMICRKFRHNALQQENWQVRLEELQIINGGQTCKTIQQTLSKPDLFSRYDQVYVLIRVYELADADDEFVQDITNATNSQNPVDLQDLHSNDDIQKQLEIGMSDLGWTYKRQRDDDVSGAFTVSSAYVAEAVLAIWRDCPQQARFSRKDHFGAYYKKIFEGLNAAQAILAVQILRYVESRRKRASESAPEFLPYASHYLAMLISWFIFRDGMSEVTHRNFAEKLSLFESQKDELYLKAINYTETALKELYGERKVSLQQLSATFRRGDLLEFLL